MKIDKNGAEFTCGVITYRIGDRVYANDRSEYNGLYGEIVEICTGDDKMTENEGPDFICRLDAPIFPEDREELEQRFSTLHKAPKTIEDLGLDRVAMSADMLNILYEYRATVAKLPIFFVEEEWVVDGEHGISQEPFTDIQTATDRLHRRLKVDMESGYTSRWTQEPDFACEFLKDYYECWLEDSYFENHYSICITPNSVPLSPTALRVASEHYSHECYKEDFIDHVMQWDEASELTDEQVQQLISDPLVSPTVEKQLNNNDRYWEAYWDSIYQAANIILSRMKGGAYHDRDVETAR